jgi:UDP-N-acetyl-D-glucosamine dehydrogenase
MNESQEHAAHWDEVLIHRYQEKNATVGVIGLGYVGLPLALRFAEVGFRVVGFDVDKTKVAKLNRSETYIERITSERIASVLNKKFVATNQYDRASEMDALIICVPTPLTKSREPDLSFVIGTVVSLLPHLRPGQLVSLESTTYPGTTDEELLPRIQSRGFQVGKDIFLVFSPEREDPANPKYHTQNTPKIVGGVTKECLRVGVALYGQAVDQVVPVSSTRVAEMTKLLENIHRAVNIGLVNEMKIVADRMGIDIHEVIRAAATKPFGFVPYYPGPGLGGHCIPIDPFYLTWKARQYGVNARFIELAGEINSRMPEWVVGKISDGLNERGRALKGSRILILGIAYKKNVDDMRESPAVEIMEMLTRRGALLEYSDPHVPVFPRLRENSFELSSVQLTEQNLHNADCVVVTTNHDAFDYELIYRHATLIVDTRGVFSRADPKVISA